jgi:hypothetical protein
MREPHAAPVTYTLEEFRALPERDRREALRPGLTVTGLDRQGLRFVDAALHQLLVSQRSVPMSAVPQDNLWELTTPAGALGRTERRLTLVETPPGVHAQLEAVAKRSLSPVEVLAARIDVDWYVTGLGRRGTAPFGVVHYSARHRVPRRMWGGGGELAADAVARETRRARGSAYATELRARLNAGSAGAPGTGKRR